MGKDYKRTRGIGGAFSSVTCDDLGFQTVINSVSEDVLAKLEAGDCLDVVSHLENGRPRATAKKNGEILGSITCAEVAKLLQCLAEGKKFNAVVTSISKGSCRIVVTPGACK
jgi:hypothetical protein